MNYLNNNKIAIVVQGTSNYVQEVKDTWKDFKCNLIFSTWKGSENKYNSSDIVIFNDEPSLPGPFNFNYQKISTYNGILKAKNLGYTHVLKIRSDYIPTNPKEFIKLLDLNKLNFLKWCYTTFLWLEYPTLNGYLDDHFVFGPIDYMLKLWDIKENFCFSPEIMLTWSYINKLSHIIDVNYILDKLNSNNDIYYIKMNNYNEYNSFAHNIKKNISNRELFGRHESIFQSNSEYLKTPSETKKFMNNKYLNFLRYFNPLPKITIIGNCDIDIIYPKNKLEIIDDYNDISGEYIIYSNKILNEATLIIEYFKKKDIMYLSTITSSPNPGNDISSELLTIDEFKNKLN